jgi:hypothetical protein
VPTIVIPYRGDAKRRLPSRIRAAAAVAMLGDVVAAALEVGHVLVVTDDHAVVPSGADVVADPGMGSARQCRQGSLWWTAMRSSSTQTFRAQRRRRFRRLAVRGLALVEALDGTTNASRFQTRRSSLRSSGPEVQTGSGRTPGSRP